MDKYLIIAAGGTGSRMGNEIPKQYLMINGKPLIICTLEVFKPFVEIEKMLVVISKSHQTYWSEIVKHYPIFSECKTIFGGPSRFHSVKAALNFIPENTLVAIHDAARPFASKQCVENCFSLAEKKGVAVPAIKINESVRKIIGTENISLKREDLRIVQTPQVFKSEIVKNAYKQMFDESFTDDAAVVEKSGSKIFMAEGNKENFKITTPFDFELASFILSSSFPSNGRA